MRAVVQRVREASVSVAGATVGAIGPGLLVLCGITATDGEADRDWLARKIVSLRIFNDDAGVMNRSLVEIGGGLLAVSQFTLFASTRKGARPSYSAAAPPEIAAPVFASFVQALERESGRPVATGEFGAEMKVSLVNDGPVTIWLDSAHRE
ncbi:MAG TPA: D-aminoacyl-tRNA deacylase [Casimicrobiaceae bacterium]|nr:D-aminoacyl-tRNA deacylase [Casimicrobiaceae bacterium]